MLDLEALIDQVPNEFKVCERCKGTNLVTLIPKLKKLDEQANIKVGCHSYCGPGRDAPFAFVNNKPVCGKDEDDLIEKIKYQLETSI